MTAQPTPDVSADGFVDSDHPEPLVDTRIRPLLARYASIVGAELVDVAEALVELRLPNAEQRWFRNRAQLRVAFTLDALEREPEAQIAVVGSEFVNQLLTAIRSRGSRSFHGRLRPELPPGSEAASLTVPITNGTAGAAHVDVAWHRVVRLLARVVVRAASEVEEHLLESNFIDAATGIPVPEAIATQCAAACAKASVAEQPATTDVPLGAARPLGDLISISLAGLRAGFEPTVMRLREDAQRRLAEELLRIDGYYESLLSNTARTDDAEATGRRAIETEYSRRRGEEERRHQVRAVVHPVQLTECELLVQRAQWELVNRRGVRAPLIAQRWLNGSGDWTLACPECNSSSIRWLSVCKEGHVACDRCALTCGVCDEDFCWDHGIAACHVDGHPTCTEHARTCVSCHEPYCTAHEATCVEGEHPACSECVQACVICGRAICNEHARLTSLAAPRGQRRLCGRCVQPCEGGRTEHVGIDEVTRCTSCTKYVCEHHRSTCAVDQSVHCSTHLRRTDASRRLVCETHRDECVFEPGAVFASDEIAACTSCGRQGCGRHVHACVEDGQLYCDKDALPLRNSPGKFVCLAHAAICHVDKAAYRVGDIVECPVCAQGTCKGHLRACASCGRSVCVTDRNATRGRCGTCEQLRDIADPPDALVDAVALALKDGPRPKHWRAARDATHTIVEVDLGWTRRAVVVVRHGENVASAGQLHSALGTRKLSLSS